MVKEWKIGKHHAVFDEEKNVFIMDLNGDFEGDDVVHYARVTTEAFAGMEKDRNILIDLSNSSSGMMSKDTRESLKREFEKVGKTVGDHIAVVGASPSIRMLSKVIIKVVSGGESTRLFKTREEAYKWFREE